MSKEDYSIIDTKVWGAIQSPGLRATKLLSAYDSPQVQQILSEAFATMFPSIVAVGKHEKRYQSITAGGVDEFTKAIPAKNISDIPRAEMMRLMEGWIRLRRKLQEEAHPDSVTAILLNFRVPNPRQSLDRYMLLKKGDETRLIIRWGYETQEQKAVSLERAISILMDVPLGHMRSILSTTMSPSTSTVAVGPLLAAAEEREQAERSNELGRKKKFYRSAAAVMVGVLAVAGGIYAFSEVSEQRQVVEKHVEEDAFVFSMDDEPLVEDEVVEAVAFEETAIEVHEADEPRADVALVVEEKPNLDALMADLAKRTEPLKSEQKPLTLEAMIQSENPPKQSSADLLSEMVH